MTVIKTFFLIFLIYGCTMNTNKIELVKSVDIDKFMGDWYVIANIPTFIEKDAFNAKESYKLNDDGTIATTFTFNQGSLDGPLKTYRPKGFVIPGSNNALWGMQFIWPIKAQYKIVYLDENYQTTIVARDALDYVWLMSRKKMIPKQELENLINMISHMGYDKNKLKITKHQ
jgi:apolipoprotein D and lipocalin family protein